MSIKGKETKIYLDKNKVQSRYFYIFTKRILDIIFSLIVSIWIKLCDNGPVFYVQERVGLNGKRFNIYKFRSMYVNADLLLEKLKQEMKFKDQCLK